jgi:mycothiol synthase
VFRLRPSSRSDDQAVLLVLASREARDAGEAHVIRGMLLDQWRLSEFDPGADAVVAEEAGTVVGYGAVFTPGALALVDRRHEGQGIGSALLAWLEARARELGQETHRQPVPGDNAAGHALLAAAGYTQVRTVVQMARALRAPPDVPPPPAGIALHELDARCDAEALHAADAAAFAANPDYQPPSLGAFREEHLETPELDPQLSRVARRGETVAGFTLCRRSDPDIGYIDLLAVDERERGRGLGTVLLLSAFASFADAGLREAQLEVASDNARGLRLYERAGMSARAGVDVFEKPEPHRDLRTRRVK